MRSRDGGNLGSADGRRKLKRRHAPYWVPIMRGCALGYRKGTTGGMWIARQPGEDGKGYRFSTLGAADDLNDGAGLNYKDALKQARRIFGLPSPSASKLTVSGALDHYLAQLRSNNAASTIADAEARIEALIRPRLGKVPLSKLTAPTLRTYLTELRDGRTQDTVSRIWAYLKAALNLAWRDRLVPDDTAWRSIRAAPSTGSARKVFLSTAQSKQLLECCAAGAFRDLVRAALVTGARYGELVGLRVRDFDPDSGTVEIRTAAGGELDRRAKTGARTVYLSDEALALFARLAKDREPNALLLPKGGGGSWGKNHHQKLFARAVAAAALPADATFYCLRHTSISGALKAGVHIQVVAENCGTSVRMIEKHYGKFLRQDRRAMFNRIPELD